MIEDSIKIRLFGESIRIYNLIIKPEYKNKFNNTAIKLNQPLGVAILDVRFFNLLKLNRYKSIDDLKKENIQSSFLGLNYNGKDYIEIKTGRKRLDKLNLRNLIFEETLFPLYKVKKTKIAINYHNGLMLIEKEVGNIAEFQLRVDGFNVEKLQFFVGSLDVLGKNTQILYKLEYDGIELNKVKSDALLTYVNCIELHCF